jgi:hypothetical protein
MEQVRRRSEQLIPNPLSLFSSLRPCASATLRSIFFKFTILQIHGRDERVMTQTGSFNHDRFAEFLLTFDDFEMSEYQLAVNATLTSHK